MTNDILPEMDASVHSSAPTRSWIALGLLLAAYTISFIDRTAVSVVQESLKAELGLSDWHLGLMIGPAFAIIYALTGLPMARLAERGNRPIILAACVGVWSLMAMACGLARNFVELFIARMGVGVGEAGGNPTSHSLIADLFPQRQRSIAIAVYSLGAPLGTFLGAALVGWLAQTYGWRTAFLMLGPPGIIIAFAIWWVVPSPPRGTFETRQTDEGVPPFVTVLREALANSAFRHLVWGASLVVMVGYSVAAFLPALLQRNYHLPMTEVGLIAGLVTGVGGGIGTMLGGVLGDRWAAGKPERLARIAALAALTAAPLTVCGILSATLSGLVGGAFLGTLAIYTYIAPAFAQVHGLATARTRATVIAIFYLITNLIGLGLGPPLVGAISDAWARNILNVDATAFSTLCTRAKLAADPACADAAASGLTAALVMISTLSLVASVHFLIVARRHRGGRTLL